MKTRILFGCLLMLVMLGTGCSTVPITGRKQVRLVPDSTMIAQSAASYREVISEGPLSTDQRQTAQIRLVVVYFLFLKRGLFDPAARERRGRSLPVRQAGAVKK